jgi:hypothetical protein
MQGCSAGEREVICICLVDRVLVGLVVVLSIAYLAAIVLCLVERARYVKRLHGMRRHG